MDTEKAMIEIASNVISEVAKPAYDDLVHPAAIETGKAIGRIPRLLNALCIKFDIWATRQEYNLKMVENELENQLLDTPPEKIVEPDPYIAVPALQAISYSYDNDELRSMYAHLLSKAMHEDYRTQVHPSFIEIIKQLSPTDCLIFREIMTNQENPLIDAAMIVDLDNKSHQSPALKNINSFTSCKDYEQSRISIDNLERLKLIEIPPYSSYTNKDIYVKILNSPACVQLKNMYGEHIVFNERALLKTSFADLFYQVCVKDI